MAHTPAPWELMPSGTLRSQDGTHIGTLSMNGALIESEFNANAALIAAAPELLEALLNLLQIAEGVRENTTNNSARQFQQMHIDAARAAIRKAGAA